MKLCNTPIQYYSEEDIAGLLELSLAQDWPHSLEDWRTILHSGLVFGHRAASGSILSSAAYIPYGPGAPAAGAGEHARTSCNRIAILGMVMVDRGARRQGLGEQLIQYAVRMSADRQPAVPLCLVATEMGRPLYEKLGFRSIEKLHKFTRPAGLPRPPGETKTETGMLRPIAPDLHSQVIELDRAAFGSRRDRFLAQRLKQAETGLLLYQGRRATGYGLLIRQNDLAVLGPVVAPDDTAALTILTALMATTESAFRIDLPARQSVLFRNLRALGFVENDVPPTMLRGLDRLPGKRERYYAIAAQAFC